MTFSLEMFIALRYLRSRRKEGFVSVVAGFSLIGIALGVATLIVVMAVMAGVKQELISRIVGISPHIMVYSGTPRLFEYEALKADIAKYPAVVSVTPVIEGQVMVSANNQTSGAQVNGISPSDIQKNKFLMKALKQGSLSGLESGEGVLIGARMAEKLGLHKGDTITLISPEGRATPAGVMPRIKSYEVSGIFEIGMYEYDVGLLIIPLGEAQVFFKHRDYMPPDGVAPGAEIPSARESVSGLQVMIDEPEHATSVAAEMAGAIPHRGTLKYVDWQSQRASLFEALAIQRNVMAVILFLIIVVASFTLISGLVMLVQGKGRDIAILRTMGAGRGTIQRIFILSGSIIGAVGTLMGVGLGLVVAANIGAIQIWLEHRLGVQLFGGGLYFFTALPSRIYPHEVAMVAAIAFMLAFLATLYPARRAARLDPAEALRYE